MSDILRKYLLESVAFQAPESPGGPDNEDERIEVDPEDDEDPGDAEGGDEGDDDEVDDSQEAAQPASGRGSRQFGALRDTNRTLAEENAKLAREVEELRRRSVQAPPQWQQPRETPEQRAARLAAMQPEDRLLTMFNEELQMRDARDAQFRGQMHASSDKAAFDATCAHDKWAKKYSGEVEKQFQYWAQQGQFISRDVLLNQIIAQQVRKQSGQPSPRATENRRRNEAKPPNTRNDVPASRGRSAPGSAEDFERRFGDVQI